MEGTEADAPPNDFASLAATATPRPAHSRGRAALIPALVVACVVASGIAWAVLAPREVQPTGPRVGMDVRGMHCPIQCGLRAANALESLPWVVKGSTEADPKRGYVTFAVTDPAAVDPEAARRAIRQAGFTGGDVRVIEREPAQSSDPAP